jgi:hypothetical protein
MRRWLIAIVALHLLAWAGPAATADGVAGTPRLSVSLAVEAGLAAQGNAAAVVDAAQGLDDSTFELPELLQHGSECGGAACAPAAPVDAAVAQPVAPSLGGPRRPPRLTRFA